MDPRKMPDTLTDEQMAQLEANPSAAPDVLTDDEMAAFESAQARDVKPTENWKKLSQLNGMALPGSEWSMPDEATVNDPVVRQAMKEQIRNGAAAALGGVAAEYPAFSANALPRVGRAGVSLGRIGTGGAIGGAVTPEDPLHGFLNGAKWATGIEGVGQALGVVGKGAKWFGQKLGGLTKPQAEAYVAAPAEAERLANMNRTDPMGLNREVEQKIGGGLEESFDRVAEPALERVGKAVAQKTVRVRPDQFQGSAAMEEIQRAHDLRNPTRYAPYTKTAPYTPVEPTMRLGPVEEQTAYLPGRPYDPPVVEVQSVERGFAPTGKPGLAPSGAGYEPLPPKPLDEAMSLHGPQALRAKRAAMKAAEYKNRLSVSGYDPASEVDASAARNLKLGLEGAAPDIAQANKVLEESARYSGAAKAKFSNNPSAILTDSESVGSVPTRAMRQFLDKNGNAGLENMSNQYGAGQKLIPPETSEGLWGLTRRVGAKKLLNGSANADSAEQILQDMRLREFLTPNATPRKKDGR